MLPIIYTPIPSFKLHGVKLRWIIGFVFCLLWKKPQPASLSAAKNIQSSQQPRMWKQQDSNISNDNTESMKFLLITHCGGCLSGGVYSVKYWSRIMLTVSLFTCQCDILGINTLMGFLLILSSFFLLHFIFVYKCQSYILHCPRVEEYVWLACNVFKLSVMHSWRLSEWCMLYKSLSVSRIWHSVWHIIDTVKVFSIGWINEQIFTEGLIGET